MATQYPDQPLKDGRFGIPARYWVLAAALRHEQFTVKEIADFTGLKLQTVRSALAREPRGTFEPVARLRSPKRGGQPKVFRLVESAAARLQRELDELVQPAVALADSGAEVELALDLLLSVSVDSIESAHAAIDVTRQARTLLLPVLNETEHAAHRASSYTELARTLVCSVNLSACYYLKHQPSIEPFWAASWLWDRLETIGLQISLHERHVRRLRGHFNCLRTHLLRERPLLAVHDSVLDPVAASGVGVLVGLAEQEWVQQLDVFESAGAKLKQFLHGLSVRGAGRICHFAIFIDSSRRSVFTEIEEFLEHLPIRPRLFLWDCRFTQKASLVANELGAKYWTGWREQETSSLQSQCRAFLADITAVPQGFKGDETLEALYRIGE